MDIRPQSSTLALRYSTIVSYLLCLMSLVVLPWIGQCKRWLLPSCALHLSINSGSSTSKHVIKIRKRFFRKGLEERIHHHLRSFNDGVFGLYCAVLKPVVVPPGKICSPFRRYLLQKELKRQLWWVYQAIVGDSYLWRLAVLWFAESPFHLDEGKNS